MAYDVFISYSTADKTTADAICHALESRGIRCWIAPRDASPGAKYQGSIMRAIRESRAMVLVFSTASNSSEHVFRELHAASEHAKPVVPFRIEDVRPSDDMSFYLGPLHWLDALTPPLEQHIERLAQALAGFAPVEPKEAAASITTPPRSTGVAQAAGAGGTTASDLGTGTGAPAPDMEARSRTAVGAGRPAVRAGSAWLLWSATCAALAATTVYALEEGWRHPSLLDWLGSVLVYTPMFIGLAVRRAVRLRGPAARLKGARLAMMLMGAAVGWWLGLVAQQLYLSMVDLIVL